MNVPVFRGRELELELLDAGSTPLVRLFRHPQQGGGISLTAVAVQNSIVVTVADNGMGMAPEVLSHVFDLFVRDPRAIAVHSGGLGIGLGVVRELVEAHGGSVVVNSAGHDLGSEFVVMLRMAPADGAFA